MHGFTLMNALSDTILGTPVGAMTGTSDITVAVGTPVGAVTGVCDYVMLL